MFKKISIVVLALLALSSTKAQKTQINSPERPKLVVGLVVDQMRWDYLYRYEKQYGEGGFKRLLGEGFSLNNVMIPYIPTVTAIGHTSIYTGSIPSIHGIVGNSWRDRNTGESIYCTEDKTVTPMGSVNAENGSHSPRNLLSTTVTDQLRLATNFRSKVVGVSLKDRASILPAGHNPTAAFWFDDTTGNFISSSYYFEKELPKWVDKFNDQKIGERLVSKGWDTYLPMKKYVNSSADDVAWENALGTAEKPVFPYKNLAQDYQKTKGVIRTTPFGNTLTLRFAQEALDNYDLGKGEDTDFLAINLASTDYVGHSYGPNSVEIEDTYIRLDQDLNSFFKYLDNKVGKGNYLVFLSADHGASHSEGFLTENKILGGFFNDGLSKNLNQFVKEKYGTEKVIMTLTGYQVYLNEKIIKENKLDLEEVKSSIIDYLNTDPNILYAEDFKKLNTSSIPEPIKSRAINGFNWKRTGHIQIISKDGMLPTYVKKGTTHSVWNSYDAHIPLVFMGWGISKGESNKPYFMTDIAPTISALLHIEFPSGNVGNPIVEVIGR